MEAKTRIFDRSLVARHRSRALAGFGAHDFLFRLAAEGLVERLDTVRRDFPLALQLGARAAPDLAARPNIGQVVLCDLAPVLVAAHAGPRLVADEEALPIAEGALDLVVSGLGLHWVNDLPGALVQLRRALKPDGMFLAALLGGQTLAELRQCLTEAELAVAGGAAPRVSPMVELSDMAGLMLRAGFALPVVDSEKLTVTWPNLTRLMADIRGMGEANAVAARHGRPARREMFALAEAIYRDLFGLPDGRLPASFEILWCIGWAPAASQPRPLARGSATASLADFVKPRGER